MYGLNAEKLPVWLKTLIIVGGLVSILLVANKCRHHNTLRENGCSTSGEVTSVSFLSRWSFIYEVEGKKYENHIRGIYNDVNVGEKYKVFYDCSKPEDAFIDLNQKVSE